MWGISARLTGMRRRGLWGGAKGNAARGSVVRQRPAFYNRGTDHVCWAKAGNRSTAGFAREEQGREAMLEGGFILLHRSILRWEWYGDLYPPHGCSFICC